MPGPTGPGTCPLVSALGTDVTKAQGALTLRRVRRIVEEVVAVRRGAGDANLHHIDGLAIFGSEDVDDLPDGLHPNGDGYFHSYCDCYIHSHCYRYSHPNRHCYCYIHSDSYSDLPMLARVGTAVAVNPDFRLRRHARRAGWRVEGWS